MSPGHILFVGASIWAFGLACAALLRRPRTLATVSFTLGMALFGADGMLALAILQATELESILRCARIRLIILSALPCVWLTFTFCYSRGNSRRFLSAWKPVLIASSLLPLVPAFGFDHLLTIDSALWDAAAKPVLVLHWLARAIHLVVLLSAVLVLMNLERTLWAAVGTLRWRIKFVILGLGLLFAARVYTSSQALLYSVSDPGWATINAIALLFACLLITFSFFRAGLAAVDVYPSLAVIQKSITVVLAGVYLLVIGLFAKLVEFIGGETAFPLKALVVFLAMTALGLLLASDRARFLFRRFVSRHFHRPFYDYRTLWRSFTERTTSIVDEKAYAREIANLISDAVQTLSVSVWIEQPGSGKIVLAASTSLPHGDTQHSTAERTELPGIAEDLKQHTEPFALEDSREPWVEELKRRNPDQFGKGGKRVCIPLVAKGKLLGMLIVGDRVNGISFSVEDFELFKSLGAQAAGGLLNLRLTEQLLQAREMEAFQTMSAFFIHDLKNTASAMSLTLQNLPAHFDDPRFREDALRAISKSVDRINDLIGRLTLLRQNLELRPVSADLNEIVTDALAGWNEAASGKLVQRFGNVPKIVVDREQIQTVVVNLLLNARDATATRGQIQVETGQRNGWAMLSVTDNGCGMTQEFVHQSLFRPFQTTKKKGIGIGMFHSKMIVDAHRGRIEVETELNKGTTFRVLLPLAGGLQ